MPSILDSPPVVGYEVAGMRTAGLGVVCMVTLTCQGSLVSNTVASQPSHVLHGHSQPSQVLHADPGMEDESRGGPLLGATFLLGDPAHPGSPHCCHSWVGGDGSHDWNTVPRPWRYPQYSLHCQEHWATLLKERGRRTGAIPLPSCHGRGPQGGPPTTCWA